MSHPDIHAHRILILDFGSQYTQLIARRVREIGAYCEIHPFDMTDADIRAFTDARNRAFDEELQRWVASGQINFESQQDLNAEEADSLPEGTPVESPTAGNIWKLTVAEGDRVEEGQVVAVLESMKMEIPVEAEYKGRIQKILVAEGDPVEEDQDLAIIEVD